MVAARTVLGGSLYLLLASPSLMQQTWFSLGSWTWIAIIAGGAIGVGVGQWVKVRALEALGPTRVVLYGNLVPPATLFLAWVALGSEPSQLEILAGALILFGAMLLQVGDPHRPDDVRVSANEF
jgi:drug/metabolite transporter (DMT)-like permease